MPGETVRCNVTLRFTVDVPVAEGKGKLRFGARSLDASAPLRASALVQQAADKLSLDGAQLVTVEEALFPEFAPEEPLEEVLAAAKEYQAARISLIATMDNARPQHSLRDLAEASGFSHTGVRKLLGTAQDEK